MASHKEDGDRGRQGGLPSLHDMEPGKICGAVLPMSERARIQMRDTMEVIEYLLNREGVLWT